MFEADQDIWSFFSKLSIALVVAVILVVTGAIFIIFGLYNLYIFTNQDEAISCPQASPIIETNLIYVDVSGAVVSPGIYQLNSLSRVADAIEAAKGFAKDASQIYIAQHFNLAQVLEDGQKIYIPFEGENLGNDSSDSGSGSYLSINSATSDQLMELDGIGEVRAEQIISNRPYQSIEQLVEKEVLNESMLSKIKSKIQL